MFSPSISIAVSLVGFWFIYVYHVRYRFHCFHVDLYLSFMFLDETIFLPVNDGFLDGHIYYKVVVRVCWWTFNLPIHVCVYSSVRIIQSWEPWFLHLVLSALCVCVWGDRSQHWTSSSVIFYHTSWDRVSHRNLNSWFVSQLFSQSRESPCFSSFQPWVTGTCRGLRFPRRLESSCPHSEHFAHWVISTVLMLGFGIGRVRPVSLFFVGLCDCHVSLPLAFPIQSPKLEKKRQGRRCSGQKQKILAP